MASGDEPQLGGQSPDNAPGDFSPMISSVQTRAIADARGAYIVGNLHAMVRAMTREQHDQFHRAVVAQVLEYGRRLLTHLEPEDIELEVEAEETEREVIELVENWLRQPDTQPDILGRVDYLANWLWEQIIAAQYEDGPSGVAYHIAFSIRAGPIRAAFYAEEMINRLSHDDLDVARRWQVEAAWCILNGKEPPPLERTP